MLPVTHRHPLLVSTAVLAATLLSAAGVRLAAARGELWLDEIWSLESARDVQAPWEIVTRLRQDNNHPLNTLYLWAVGPGQPPLVYRLPAVLAGIMTVILAAVIASRWGAVATSTSAILFSSSYLLVHYSSEARGYAFALASALAGTECLLRYSSRRSWPPAAAFAVCCAAGFASHPIFLHFWIASAYWLLLVTAVTRCDTRAAWFRALGQAAAVHVVPLCLAVAWWVGPWRGMQLGGGPPYSLVEQFVQVASLTLGGPWSGWGAWLASGLCVAGVALSVNQLRNARVGHWIAMAVLLPMLHAAAIRPPFLFLRYFLLAVVFALLALAIGLSRLYARGPAGRAGYFVLLFAFVAANLFHVVPLVRLGRGQVQAALSFLGNDSSDAAVTVSSDHDFGIRKLMEFHSPQVKPRRAFVYVNGQEWPPSGPQWVVLHREPVPTPTTTARILVIEGHVYRLERIFDCAPLSGWQWVCYRRVTRSGVGSQERFASGLVTAVSTASNRLKLRRIGDRGGL